MHRLKVSLLCLLSITLAGSVFGQTAPPSDVGGTAVYDSGSSGVSSYSGGATYGGNAGAYFNARYFSGNGVGYTQGYQQYGGFVPFWLSDDVVIGPDMRLLIANTGGVGGNFGGIGRKYFAGADRILGAAGYFDVDQSANRNTYTQGTFGLETLGQYWDLRGNVYYTGNTQDKFVGNGSALCVSGSPFFSGNNIVFQGQQGQYREQAMGGVDAEVGAPIFQSAPWLRGYVGAYYYKANQVQPPMSVTIPNQTSANPVGVRAHLDAWIADDLLIGVNVTSDTVWGTNVNGMVDFRFSGFKPTRYFPQWTTRERMLAPWQRNWRIAVEQYQTATNTDVVAINPITGKPYFVSFVNGDNPDAGTGTFEDPFKSFNHPNGIAGADIIYVARDGSTAANPYIGTMKLLDNQILLGEGGTMTPLPLTATFGNCTVAGNFTLPGVDGSGNYPWVSSPGGHAIGLANNNEVSGFHIINSVDGILGTNINDANLRNLDIHNNSGRGINLTNVGGTVSYLDVNSSNNATGIFMSETGKTLTSTFTGVTTNNNAGNGLQVVGTGGSVTLDATDPTKPLVASGNGTDNANVNMTGGSFLGNFTGSTFTNSVGGSGFGYSQAGGTGTLNLTNSLLNNNGIDGLNLAASAAGSIAANTTGSQLNGNIRDGIHSVATGASTIITTDSGSAMNQNGRDGYFYDLSGNSVLNATFLNDSLVSNTRSAFFGLMNASTANVNMTNVLATNSGQNGFALDATAGSIFNATTNNANFSNSGANGITTTLHALSSAAFNMTGTTDNGNVQNGVSFLADNSTYSMTALSSTFNNNSMNGVVGTAQAGSTANIDISNGSSISGNAQNGVFVTTTGLSNVNGTFTNTAIDNNAAGSGVRLSMDNSPNSSLTMTGTTTLNNNGTNGLQIDATTNTVFTPNLTGTTIQGNGQDGVHINVASGSSVGTALNAGTFTNVTVTGNTGNGFDVGVTGAGSTSTLMLTNANVAGNTQSNAAVNVAQGGFLNFVTSNSDFSNSVTGAGILANVTDVNSTAYLDFDGATIDGNATVGISAVVTAPAPGVGQTGASLNVCLDDSTVSNNTLQGISIAASGAGATASFGVGQFNQNNGSTVANNGSEGVLGNAVNGGTINFREFDSHFDNNGQTVVADGVNFGANAGTIRTLFYGGSADGNSGDGVSLGPISPNVSSFGSDLTVSLANGFSGSNNGGYGLVLDGNGANSANLLQDPNTPAAVFNGNGAGSQNLNFSGVNQVVLQELGSFDGMAGDGAHFVFNNVTTAIISFNGLGTGTINGNGQNGLFVQFNNVQNGSVLIGGYTDISGNGADGVHVEFNGASAVTPMNAAFEIDGVAGKTNMDGNGANAVNVQLLNANMVNNFTSLPGVSLTILTPTSNDSFNACIPLPVSQAGGLAGITPNTGLNLNNLNITNSTQQGIVVAGTNSTIASGASISNNNVSGSLGGDGITVTLNETSARAIPNADGFIFNANNVHDNVGNGITFGVTNTAVSTVTSANNLTFTNNTVSNNGVDGINLNFTNPAGSTAAVNNFSFTGDTIDGNGANGVNVNLSGVNVASTMTNETITNNTLDGIVALVNGTGTANQTKGVFTLTGSTVTGNGGNGGNFTVDNAGTLGVNLLGGTLIDSNTVDGVLITATNANTTVTSTITGSTLTNNGTGGTGNGLTGTFDSGAVGTFTIDTSTFGNTAAVGGTQINGLELNVNQNAVATATNVIANITNTTFSNNEASGIAGNITGNNGGLNPTTGAEITLDTVTVSGNLGNGMAFIVDNAALLQMSVDTSMVTGNGQNGMFITADNVNTLVAIDMSDSGFNNNGTIIFPGDGFNATVNTGATLNVCAETTGAAPMSFSGNTGDGFDVQVNDPGSRSDIDFHSVIAGASAADGLLGNTLNGVIAQSFDGGDVNLRAYTTHFDGNGGAGLFGAATNTISDPSTIARYRIIGGTANGNTGDGFKFVATNTAGAPTGGTELTAQFQADDFGTGISAQNNGGFGLEYTTSTPGGGINANLLMTGGSQLLNNGAGTLNVNMGGADQVIIGLSGTFDGSTTGDGIHIDLQNITGLALVSLQGPGEVRNNAGDGIDVSMTNVAQGGVFIGGFSDVSNNGTGNNALIGQDGIKVTMNNVGLGAITIDSQTASLPANIMNVSNNTGNGVNVTVNNNSVIDNTAFNAILGAKLVNVIDYTAPDAPCPTPLPNPLLTIVPVNASTALGITFQPTLSIQNLNVDNNGNATGGNLSGDGIVLTADTLARIVGTPSINNNIVTNTGSTSATGTHDGIVLQVLGNADVTNALITTNDVENNNGNGITVNANLAATLASLNITDNTILNNTGTLGVTGNGIDLNLVNAAVLATVNIDGNDVEGNDGDGFQMVNPATGVDLTVNFLHNQFIGNGSIVPPSATSTYPPGGMGIDIVLNNQNAIRNTINILSDATGVNTISDSASFGVFLQATNQSLYNLNVTGTGAKNIINGNVDAGIAVVGGSFVNPNNSLDPSKFSVGNVLIDNVDITNTVAGSHPSLPNYPFSGDGIGILLQQYAEMNSFVVGSAAARNTTLANNAGDGLRINAIEQSQFRQTLADNVTPVTTLGQATILLQQIDATGNGRNGIDIIRRDNALLSWDDATVNPGAALFSVFNPVSWQAITDGGSFIHINDVIATSNGINGLNVSTTNAQFPITRIDITDTAPVAMGYNPKVVGHSQYDLNNGRGMQFVASADSILVVNAQDTSASENLQGGILVQTFNRATFGDVLVATPLGDPTSDNSIRSTFNGMLISGNGRSNLNANAHGFEVQANGGADPNNVSSSSVVNISMTGTATNARNLFDSNGGDDFRVTASRFSDNYFNLNRIDMRDTAFVHLNSDGVHVLASQQSTTRLDLTNASIGFPTASSTQTGLSGDGIDVQTTGVAFMNLNVGNTLALNRFGDGIAVPDPINAPDVSIYGNRLNGIVIRNQVQSAFLGSVYDTASRFNGNRGYSAEMQDNSTDVHIIDHSLFSDNSFEGIAIITNARTQSNTVTNSSFVDVASLGTGPSFPNAYNAYNFLNYNTFTNASFTLTNSQVENNGGATPYVNTVNNVNGLEIDVSSFSQVVADIRNNVFHGNTLDDVATASFIATTGGFNANGTISTVGQVSTPGSIDEIVAGVDRIFLEDTAQLDMRFMHNVGDQVRISSGGSNNPNMNATGDVVTDPNTKAFQRGIAQTSLFQVNAFHYDTVNTVTSNNVFTGNNVQPLDSNVVAFVQDALHFPGSTTQPGNVVAIRNLEAAIVNQAGFYTNPDAFPNNAFPTAFTQVRVDDITTGVNGTGANGVTGYTAAGQFTLAGAGSVGITPGDVFRIHLLDTNTFNQFGVAQNVEAAFQSGFQQHVVRIPQGQTAGGTGTFFTTNPLAPYFQWPSNSFPPN
ncbi:MAG: Parallel beta-helix repeat protein [Schlesneria sp.]|nr:Parallel beta-helix repeat protein [Schlesneria sp.]